MAFWAQLASQAMSQQEKSREQMSSQQVASAQPGEVLGAQQSFAFGAPQVVAPSHESHRWFALFTQRMSQPVLQQKGSIVQTVVQQAASEQPGIWLGAQQSLAFGAPHWANAEPAIASEVPKPRAIS